MFFKIAQAILVAVVVGLALLFLGMILDSLKVPILETIGSFLASWCWVIGVIAGLWYLFFGFGTFTINRRG